MLLAEPDERDLEIVGLLKQLSNGLLAYRLYPGDLEQAAFVNAVQRIRAAAERALVNGSVVVEVHGEEFRTRRGPLPNDESLQRLARSCYERKTDLLRVRALPEPEEMSVVYDALTMKIEDIEEVGGVEKVLEAGNVSSLTITQIKLSASEFQIPEGLNGEQAEMWERLQHGEELIQGAGAAAPMVEADSLYGQLQELINALPKDMVEDPDLYGRLGEAVDGLPEETRRALASKFVANVRDGSVAQRLLTTMTDADLAHTLAEASKLDGSDPEVVAQEIVDSGLRRDDNVVQLARATKSVGHEAGHIVPMVEGLFDSFTGGRDGTDTKNALQELLTQAMSGAAKAQGAVQQQPLMQTVSDLLGRELALGQHEDSLSIAQELPSNPTELLEESMATLEDYLGVEEDVERLEQVLDVWATDARDCLKRGETQKGMRLVDGAMRACERASKRDASLEPLFKTYRRRVLDSDLLRDLIRPGESKEDLYALLAPFGDVAVDALFDLLADEQDRGKRAAIMSVLGSFAKEYWDKAAARLEDQRWFLVRNALIILAQSDAGDAIAPLIEKATRHDHPVVRKEAIRALVPLMGEKALPSLRKLSKDIDKDVRAACVSLLGRVNAPMAVATLAQIAQNSADNEQRKQAIDELGAHPAYQATKTLKQLGSLMAKPRLPWNLRRHAVALARQRVSS